VGANGDPGCSERTRGVGLGVGTLISANWALVTDIVPREEAARYLGIADIATAGSSGLARFLGGALIRHPERNTRPHDRLPDHVRHRRRLLPAERIGDHPLALSEKALGIS